MEKEQVKYIISPITTWDNDEMLWATKVGVDKKGLPLHYTVWGKTNEESKERAINLLQHLSK